MNGFQFEEYLKELFIFSGFQAEVTQKSRDYGADLILTDSQGIKTTVQAKRWNSNVGIKAIQEAYASMPKYKADKSIVITNSYFTKEAIELADVTGVTLVDREKLVNWINEISPQESIIELKDIEAHKIPVCENCQTGMELKKGKYGYFYGCINYPSCKHTINYEKQAEVV